MQVGKYHMSDNISYSLLKNFDDNGPKGLIKPKKLTGVGVQFGSMFDDYLSLEKNEFDSKYEVLPMKPLEPAVAKLASVVREHFKLEDIPKIKDSEELQLKIVEVIKAYKFFSNVKKAETFIKKFNFKDFYTYVETCYLDKVIMYTSDLSQLREGKTALFTNKRTKDYLINDFENIYQLELNYPYKDENIKCILDMVIIDHENKIIKGVDLKTGTPKAEDFSKNFFMFKYYLQGALYYKGLEYYNQERFNGEYTIEPFRFLYMCRTDMNNPLVYILSEKWRVAAFKGFTTTSGYTYRGIDELIDEIKWHKSNKVFDYTRELYENLELELKDSYININE